MADINADARVSPTHQPMGFPEFVVIIATIMALNPLAMDMMLPALPDIGDAFRIRDANAIQAVLSAFVIGFGLGQPFIGPLADRFGRRPVLLIGMVVYTVASLLAIVAPSFELLLIARFAQGLSTSATRVIAIAIVRDCYTGRRMASVMSLVMMVFIAVPVIAPSLGQLIRLTSQWRSIFVVLTVYGIVALGWSAWRIPETLPESASRSLKLDNISDACWRTVKNRQTLGYAIAAGAVQGVLFAFILSSQQIFTGVYHLGTYFTWAFAAIALGIAASSFLNSRLVNRLGMRKLSHGALIGYACVGSTMLLLAATSGIPLAVFVALSMMATFCFGLLFANFTSLAMEPQGDIAGTASSLYGSITTLLGIAIGYSIGQAFDGTVLPFAAGGLLSALGAILVVLITEKGRLFTARGAASSVTDS